MKKNTDIPKFGKKLGFWYPLIWRILSTNKYWSPSMWLPKESGLSIDIYVSIWWLIEILTALSYKKLCGPAISFIIFMLTYRLIDLLFVLFSILLKGFYRRGKEWLSANRLIFFTICNTIEIMFIFGFFYYTLSVRYPQIVSFSSSLKTLFESFYFSVVTGTTLGYGTPYPISWGSQLLTIIETLIIFLIAIVLIGHLASARESPTDRENQ
ncbi:MAG: ion channel [Candidatus Omnitrophota bacterium]|jgi:hypothetical protein